MFIVFEFLLVLLDMFDSRLLEIAIYIRVFLFHLIIFSHFDFGYSHTLVTVMTDRILSLPFRYIILVFDCITRQLHLLLSFLYYMLVGFIFILF